MSPGGRSPLRGTTSATAEIARSCRRRQCSTVDTADTSGASEAGVTAVSPARAAARSGGGVGGRDARTTADAHDHRPGLHPPYTTTKLHLSCWHVSRWGRKGCRGGFGTRQCQAVELCDKWWCCQPVDDHLTACQLRSFRTAVGVVNHTSIVLVRHKYSTHVEGKQSTKSLRGSARNAHLLSHFWLCAGIFDFGNSEHFSC